MGRVKELLVEGISKRFEFPHRQIYTDCKGVAGWIRGHINTLLDCAENAYNNDNLETVLELSFLAGMMHEGLFWLMDNDRTSAATNAKRNKKSSKQDSAIAELLKRHKQAPGTGKMALLQNMASVENGKKWGKIDTLKAYCKEVKLTRKKV